MTGKELIIFILNYNLLDINLEDWLLSDSFLTLEQASVKLGIGTDSLSDMVRLGLVDHAEINGQIYLHKDIQLTNLKRR